MKYDSHGTWESNNYHGLGWQAKHGDRGFRPAGEYEKGYRARRDGETDAEYEVRCAAEEPGPVDTDGVTANSVGIVNRRPFLPTPMTKGMDGGSNSRKAFARRDPEGAKQVLGKSYPTPVVADSRNKQSKRPPERVRLTASGLPEADRPSGNGAQLSLAQAAHVVDGAKRARVWPTPVAHEDRAAKYTRETSYRHFVEGRQTHLAQPARDERMFPTPNSSNGLRGGGHGASAEHRPGKWQSPGHPEYGELNPEWVEWIMGWPLGWTSPEPIAEHAVANWMAQNLAGPDGRGEWWRADPSDAEGSGVTKTVKAGDEASEKVRVARIAALGNGQVSAVVAAVWTQLWHMKMPKGE